VSLGSSGRIRLLASAALLVTFVAGALGGAAVERVRSTSEPAIAAAPQQRRDDDCPPVRDPNRRRRTPYDDLGLSEAQKSSIDSVLHSQGAKMGAVSREERSRMESIVDGTRAAIRTMLTPEQQTEMDRRRTAWAQRDSTRREERRIRCAAQQDSSQAGRQDSGPQERPRIP
jgi:hypothetical protein